MSVSRKLATSRLVPTRTARPPSPCFFPRRPLVAPPNASTTPRSSEFRRLIVERRDEVLTAWVKEQIKEGRAESLPAAELRAQGAEFLTLIADPEDSQSILD